MRKYLSDTWHGVGILEVATGLRVASCISTQDRDALLVKLNGYDPMVSALEEIRSDLDVFSIAHPGIDCSLQTGIIDRALSSAGKE